MSPTKRKLETDNRALRGASPPDTPDLIKNLEKANIAPQDVGMDNPDNEFPQGDSQEDRPIRKERSAEEYLTSIRGPATLQQMFQYSLMKFGYKEGQATSIADYAATTGDADIFKDPAKLLDCMREFAFGNPSQQKVSLDFYIKRAKINSNPEYEEKIRLTPGEVDRLDKQKKEAERIYYFDSVTGDIRPPRQGEQGMTSEQAQTFKDMWDVKHPNAHTNTNESDWVPGPDGSMIPNPNKKYTALEHAALEAANRPGEITQLIQSEELKKRAQEAGVLPGGGTSDKKGAIFGMTVEEFTAFKTVFAPQGLDPGLKTLLENQQKILEELVKGKEKTEDPRIKELENKYETEREARHQAELTQRDKQITEMNQKIETLANRPPAGNDTELGVIKDLGGKFMDKADKGLGEIVGLLRTNPPPMGRTELKNFKDGLKEGAKEVVKAPEVTKDIQEIMGKHKFK
jgi:hypothetical protein